MLRAQALLLALLIGCFRSSSGSEDDSPLVDGGPDAFDGSRDAPDAADGLCDPDPRLGTCEGVLDIELSGRWSTDPGPEHGIATVEAVEATGGGTGNTTVFLAADGVHRIELPAEPALTVGETVQITRDDYGFFLHSDGAPVAYVGSTVPDSAFPLFRSAADGRDAELDLGGLTFGLRPICAGAYERNDSCYGDVGVVAMELVYRLGGLGLGKSTITVDGQERVIDIRRLLHRDDRYGSDCEGCGDVWLPLVDVAMVFDPE